MKTFAKTIHLGLDGSNTKSILEGVSAGVGLDDGVRITFTAANHVE